jgi:HAD superfamily hydrolase (TIGR01549 family)
MQKPQKVNDHHRIQGIIFDLDGTLIKSVVDFPKMKNRMIEFINDLNLSGTNYSAKQTTVEIISDLNIRMHEDNISAQKQNEIFVRISEILTEVEFENINKVELLPGVREFILDYRENGLRLGILTRASEKYTKECLRLTKLEDCFHSVVTRDKFNILKAKPDLHALEYIIQELNVPSENLLFVGDHNIDYTCAQAGKIRFVGVLAGAYNRKLLEDYGSVTLVEDFFELSDYIKEFNSGIDVQD